jgi:hypothetical protein
VALDPSGRRSAHADRSAEPCCCSAPSAPSAPSAYLIEGGLQQWSALQLETTLGASPALSGLAPKLLSGSLAAGRLLAQRFARRSGDNRLVALAGAGSAIGSGLVAAAPSAPIALLGVKVSGLGLPAAAPTRPRKAWRGSWPGASSRLHYSSIAARLPS